MLTDGLALLEMNETVSIGIVLGRTRLGKRECEGCSMLRDFDVLGERKLETETKRSEAEESGRKSKEL